MQGVRSVARRGRLVGVPGRVKRKGLSNYAYQRTVKFPPSDALPLPWLAFGFFFMRGMYSRSVELIQADESMKELVRKASSEAWGANRVVESMRTMLSSLLVNNGQGFWGWMNAAPFMVSNQVVDKAIKGALLSENADVSDQSAGLLAELLAQPKMTEMLCTDEELFENVLSGLEKWIDIKCLDCGNPAPSVHPLVTALSSLVGHSARDERTKDIVRARLDRLVPLMNKIALKIEKSQRVVQRERNVWSIQIGQAPPLYRNKHSSLWYTDVGFESALLCEHLAKNFPERSLLLVPAFNRLSRTFFPLFDMNKEEMASEDLLDFAESPTFDLGMHIHAQADKVDSTRPESVSDRDWRQFKRTKAVYSEFDTVSLVGMLKTLESLETFLEPVLNIFATGAFAFLWGGMRSFVALKGVENPAQLSLFQQPHGAAQTPAPAQYTAGQSFQQQSFDWRRQQQPGMYPQNTYQASQMTPQQHAWQPQQAWQQQPQQHQATAYNQSVHPNLNQLPAQGWRRVLIVRQARLAATGAMLLSAFYQWNDGIASRLWVEDSKKQVALAAPKTLAELSLVLFAVRKFPYCLLPYCLFAIETDVDDRSF